MPFQCRSISPLPRRDYFERLQAPFAHVSAVEAMKEAAARRRAGARCGSGVMSNAWQIYQARLAALPREQPTQAPGWLPGRRPAMRIRCQPTARAGGVQLASVAQLVRLPGIWRPDGAATVRAR